MADRYMVLLSRDIDAGASLPASKSYVDTKISDGTTQFVVSELNFSTNIEAGVANLDLTLPSNFFVDNIKVVNGNAGSLTAIQCIVDPAGDNNTILYNKTVTAGATGVFTLLGDQFTYSSSKVLRFNATGNTTSMSIIAVLKTQDSNEFIAVSGSYSRSDSNASSGTITLQPNALLNLTTTQNGTTFTLALASPITARTSEYRVVLATGASVPTITHPSGTSWVGGQVILLPNKKYSLSYEYISASLTIARWEEMT